MQPDPEHLRLANLSKEAYQTQTGGVGGIEYLLSESGTSQTVAFRGTSARGETKNLFSLAWDVMRDLRFWPWPVKVQGQWYTGHAGFIRGACKAAESLRPQLTTSPLTLTGHSLGGAVAMVVGLKLAKEGCPVKIVAFGAPKVFLRAIEIPDWVEITLYRAGSDLITYLPIGRHPVKPCKIGTSARFWPNLSDHRIDRYIELLQLIQRG